MQAKGVEKMNYKKKYTSTIGYTPLCKIGECSLQTLEFGIIELGANGRVEMNTGEKETAFIILGGKCDVYFDNVKWPDIGARRSVFEGKAHSFYMPRNKKITISTPWSVKIAVCATPIDEDTQPQVLTPEQVNTVRLGVKPWERDTHFIIDDRCNAKYLTIGEAYVTPGNWAGFPPHKHDVDAMPKEGILEELYYFLFQPQQGFAVQRMYTKDGEIDECYVVNEDELVEFPRGYHTTVGAPGYNTYFLWAMAGKHQGFFRANDPEHEWVSAVENIIKKS
jgi:5-deoxy-glucuronate isomerase